MAIARISPPELDKIIAVIAQFKIAAGKLITKNHTAFPELESKKLREALDKAKTYADLINVADVIASKSSKLIQKSTEFKNYETALSQLRKLPELLAALQKTADDAKQAQVSLMEAKTQITQAADQAKELAQLQEKYKQAEVVILAAQQQSKVMEAEHAKLVHEISEQKNRIKKQERQDEDKSGQLADVTRALLELTKRYNLLEEELGQKNKQVESHRRTIDTLEREVTSKSFASTGSSDISASTARYEPSTPGLAASTHSVPQSARGTVVRGKPGAEINTKFAKVFAERFTSACNKTLAHIAKFILLPEISADIKKDLQSFRLEFIKRYIDQSAYYSTSEIITSLLSLETFSKLNSELLKFPKDVLDSNDKEERTAKWSLMQPQKKAYYFIYQAYSAQYLAGNESLTYAPQFLALAEKVVSEKKETATSASTRLTAPATTVIPTTTTFSATAQKPSIFTDQRKNQKIPMSVRPVRVGTEPKTII